MKRNPMVSIIIPVYNGSDYIKEAIDSALGQDYDNFEVIVVNDGSTDNGKTKEIVLSYGDKVRYYEKENGGVSTALNYGISKMKGEYFSWLSHDDLYYENKLSTQIKELKKHDENTVLYSNYSIVDEKRNFIKNIILNSEEYNKKPYNSIFNMDINGITLLIPKKAFDECGLFGESLRCIQDYDLWYKMIEKYNFFHMKEILGSTRVHSKQVSNVSPRVITEGNIFYKKIADEFDEKLKIKYEGSEYMFLDVLERKLRFSSKYQEAADYISLKKKKLLDEYKIDFKKIPVCWIIDDSNLTKKQIKEITSNKKYPNLVIKFTSDDFNVDVSGFKYIYIGNESLDLFERIKLLEISNSDIIYDYILEDENMIYLDKFSRFLHADLNKVIIKNKGYNVINVQEKFNLFFDKVSKGISLLNEKSNNNYSIKFSDIKKVLNSNYVKTLSDEVFATLCYQASVIYNKNCATTLENKVKFYEECEKYKALSYSRAWKLYQKIIKIIKREK